MVEVPKNYPYILYLQRITQTEHVHIVLSFPPKCRKVKIVQIIKSHTGKAMWQISEFWLQRYNNRGGISSAGYFVSIAGSGAGLIKRSVRYQEKIILGKQSLH